MMTSLEISNSIIKASKVVGNTWPLYSFVTSNPLNGFEDKPFNAAVKDASKYLGAKVFPDAYIYRNAIENNELDTEELSKLLLDHGFKKSPEFYLSQLEEHKTKQDLNNTHHIDVITTKWLSAFMDEGLAEWQMPNKFKGFYESWRLLACYDNDLSFDNLGDIPKTKTEALIDVMKDFSEDEALEIFKNHIAALPGWTGYINHRNTYESPWQSSYPITIEDYLAVRLIIAKNLNYDFSVFTNTGADIENVLKLQHLFLKAWEKSWQKSFVKLVEPPKTQEKYNSIPDAQLVFCIDTRSDLIRRHIEEKGNYETFGYAGFFGIAMDYENLSDGVTRKSCPPILNSAYKVKEVAKKDTLDVFNQIQKRNNQQNFVDYFLKRMKNMLPSSFGYVEGAGVFYGLKMLANTLFPSKLYTLKQKNKIKHEDFCNTFCEHIENSQTDLSLDEKVTIVKSGLDLMGWKVFAPLIVFTGHGSHSANNPFASSLDCGACAASPGRHNARLLAQLANDKDVRASLNYNYNISIPNETVFIGAEHNTTTDQIELFDADIPVSHKEALIRLKVDLQKAQETAIKQRLNVDSKSVNKANKKANDWSETRPEWGLAKNAGFIIGSRALTKGKDLNGRCFLHSYDWQLDTTGKALEAIMQGPMVVTQWINNHYYFSTVDNDLFGGGTKITHNITGKFGVVQGNGGDLKIGLPLQSTYQSDTEIYHQPLRLSVLIHAPLKRVNDILLNNNNIKELLDNGWIYLMVMDADNSNIIKQYTKDLNWEWRESDVIQKTTHQNSTHTRILEEQFR